MKCPEKALLRAFLINRYRRGSDDRYFDIDTVADLLTKYAFTTAKPLEKQDLVYAVQYLRGYAKSSSN